MTVSWAKNIAKLCLHEHIDQKVSDLVLLCLGSSTLSHDIMTPILYCQFWSDDFIRNLEIVDKPVIEYIYKFIVRASRLDILCPWILWVIPLSKNLSDIMTPNLFDSLFKVKTSGQIHLSW